jgi:hypothetical protein
MCICNPKHPAPRCMRCSPSKTESHPLAPKLPLPAGHPPHPDYPEHQHQPQPPAQQL